MKKILMLLSLCAIIVQAQPRKVVLHIDTLQNVARIYPSQERDVQVVSWERLRCVDTTIRDYWHAGWTDKHSFGYFDMNWENIPTKKMDVFLRLEN